MKVLLSILFFLALAGYSSAENFDNTKKTEKVWSFGENFHSSVILESDICDEQDSNDFNGPDLFFRETKSNVRTFRCEIKKVSVFLPSKFTTALQYSLIDLPPPLFS